MSEQIVTYLTEQIDGFLNQVFALDKQIVATSPATQSAKDLKAKLAASENPEVAAALKAEANFKAQAKAAHAKALALVGGHSATDTSAREALKVERKAVREQLRAAYAYLGTVDPTKAAELKQDVDDTKTLPR